MERWQFQIDGRPAGPIRNCWMDAAQDAVNDGYAEWTSRSKSTIRKDRQCEIAHLSNEKRK